MQLYRSEDKYNIFAIEANYIKLLTSLNVKHTGNWIRNAYCNCRCLSTRNVVAGKAQVERPKYADIFLTMSVQDSCEDFSTTVVEKSYSTSLERLDPVKNGLAKRTGRTKLHANQSTHHQYIQSIPSHTACPFLRNS